MGIPDKYKPLLGNAGRVNPHSVRAFPELVQQLLADYPVSSVKEALYLAENNIKNPPVCATCGGPVVFGFQSKGVYGYNRFCSPSCAMRNQETHVKQQATNLERYGEKRAGTFGSTHFKQSMISKYGTTNVMQIPEIVESIKKTNKDRYGADNVWASSHGIDSIRQTNLKRHGVANSMQREDVKQKFRGPNGEWIPRIANEPARAKSRLETITKQVQARLAEHGFALLSDNHTDFKYKTLHTIKHECGEVMQQTLGFGRVPRCFNCNPKLVGTSKLQQKLEDTLRQVVEIKVGPRLLDGKEIDIYIPSAKLGIEVNGLFWHSELMGRDYYYHINKTECAAKQGISLIHFFEDDLTTNFDIVVSMIMSRIGITQKIHARKTTARLLTKDEAKKFCKANHLQGYAASSFAIGLEYNSNIVACATFGKSRYSAKAELELLRFCTAAGTTVVGGFTKLLSFLQQRFNPTSIISYADRSYSTGGVYKAAGFNLESISKPGYWYFKSNENIRYHRSLFQKHKLASKLDVFNPQLSEWQNMQANGWNRVWDCGQLVFILQLTT